MKTNKEIIKHINNEYEKNSSIEHYQEILIPIFIKFVDIINEKLEKVSEQKREKETLRLFSYYNNRFNKIKLSGDIWKFKKDAFIFWVIRECLLDSNLWGLHQLLYPKFKKKIDIIKYGEEQ